MNPYSEAVQWAEAVKVAWSSEQQRMCVCVCGGGALKAVQIVNPTFFCPFSTTEKFDMNTQPLPFYALKAVRHQILSPHGAKLFFPSCGSEWCHFRAATTLHIGIHTFISTVSNFATTAYACRAASMLLYGYIPLRFAPQ